MSFCLGRAFSILMSFCLGRAFSILMSFCLGRAFSIHLSFCLRRAIGIFMSFCLRVAFSMQKSDHSSHQLSSKFELFTWFSEQMSIKMYIEVDKVGSVRMELKKKYKKNWRK